MIRRAAPLSFFLLFHTLSCLADLAVVKTAGVLEFDEARNGFASICFENKKEFDLLEDSSNLTQVADSIRAGGFRLLVAIGGQAASFLKNHFPDAQILYCLVINPEKTGLKGDNITGLEWKVPIREQFFSLRTIDKKIKRVGVIYTEPLNDAIVQTAQSIGHDENLTLVTSPISSSQDIEKALSNLIGKCDALWIPPDPSLVSKEIIRYIGSTVLSRQLPFVGPSDRYVRSGAILSISIDAEEEGKAVGNMANQFLQGTSLSKLKVPESQKLKIILNIKAAGLLGLTIPKNIQNAASKIYE